MKQWPKVTITAKFKGNSLKHLEKHTQCPVVVHIWWFVEVFIFLVFERKGGLDSFLNRAEEHNMLEENTSIKSCHVVIVRGSDNEHTPSWPGSGTVCSIWNPIPRPHWKESSKSSVLCNGQQPKGLNQGPAHVCHKGPDSKHFEPSGPQPFMGEPCAATCVTRRDGAPRSFYLGTWKPEFQTIVDLPQNTLLLSLSAIPNY